MVAAAALGDVVQQHRDIEHPPRRNLLVQDRGRQRVVGLQLTALDRGEQADGPDRMLVDGIMMVHVELHLRDDAAEVGNEAAEHAGLVHPPKHRFRVIDRGQHFEEQAHWRALSRRTFRSISTASRGRRAHRRGMDLELLARSQREQLEQSHRVLAEIIVGRDGDPAAVEDEAAQPLRPPADRREREAEALLAKLLVELGEEHSGQVPNRFRVQEIELHEALDRRFSRPVGVMHDLRDARLIFEAQPLLGAPGEQVEVAAHRPEKALGPIEPRNSAARQQPRPDEVGGPLDAMDIFADPVERLEVAQARPCPP